MVIDIPSDTKTKATDDLAWRVDSVCREHPTQLWFAASARDIATAKALCGGCAAQSACLEFALSRPELLGIWAATTPSERATLRREARTAVGEDLEETVDDMVEAVATREEPQEVEPQGQRAPEDGWLPGEASPPVPVGHAGAPTAATDDDVDLDDGQPDELLTPAEAARRLGVTPNTVTRWSRAGKISAIQTIGGHRRYRKSEIEKVLRRFLQ